MAHDLDEVDEQAWSVDGKNQLQHQQFGWQFVPQWVVWHVGSDVMHSQKVERQNQILPQHWEGELCQQFLDRRLQ